MVREQEYAATRREARRRKKLKKLLNFDYTLLLIVIFILAFGLVMLYSTSAYAAALKTGNSAFYLKKQLFAACLGFVGMFFFTKIDYRRWAHLTFTFYIVSIILCISVIFIGTNINGQSRWLTLGPINIQPSEIGKVAVIMLLANTIDRYPKVFRTLKGVVWTLGIYACPLVAVVAYNNLSTAIIILGIAFIMAFVASPKYWYFLAAFGVSFLVIVASIPLVGYRADRINAWLHPEDFISDTGYQTLQGLYAIGSGGLFGKGLGESMQKYIVPEAQNDMIFSIICEELGVFGAVCIILLYILLLYRLLYIANHAKDMFGSYICIGIMAHIAIQVILNIAVVTNSMPNTGVTLPLISYGGTSVAILLSELGLALSVSKNMEFEEDEDV
ncbi:FtsW/RodA/SpoVE family cell cycle protein [Pseudobutyrivibrio sp.]|uniref:FtsW/RodA/SpoVE family cell cycle protein n=1 Tax=Pseudobutyrivibrio sp. TaxID=2014367 RepID=UPI001B0CFA04|nr:putative peptidoglycan glycosyltransferase FtsW [Pseudobutyrivibrio sp.]MBO5617220.1 cell division protein FtsW [Pseudobutyrivibrio sp.]MBP3263486.1 cell division protein FtsW [Pseudobutyrivibrio sp.]